MIEFGALPPEINSGRMYIGAGAAPMAAAAAAWDELGTELSSSAAGYSSVTTELTGSLWLGPASRSMIAAATPFITWLRTAAGLAHAAGAQARSAMCAYETAFTMTVPPSAVAANRARLAALIATNFFGQNTPAIAATDAEYGEMWAQDAAAMYGYAAAASTAAHLAPFTEPVPSTNDAGMAAQQPAVAEAVATAAASGGPSATQSSLNDIINTLSSQIKGLLFGPLDVIYWPMIYVGSNVFSQIGALWPEHLAGVAEAGVSATPALAAPVNLGDGLVSANLATSNTIGSLSVPTGWAATAPQAAEQSIVQANGIEDASSKGPETLLRQIAPVRSRRGRGGLPPREYGFRPRFTARPPSAG